MATSVKKSAAKTSSAKKTSSTKASTKKSTPKKASGKRELIAPNNDKRYIRRDANGRFTESDDQGRSLSQDIKRKAKAKPGFGDRGDQKMK